MAGRQQPDPVVASIAELEIRDGELASRLDAVRSLTQDVDRVRTRAAELESVLNGLPDERATLDAAEPDVRRDRDRVRDELAASATRLERLEAKRRADVEELDQARREHTTAVAALADADARLARIEARRIELDELETAARAESDGLQVDAGRVARAIAALPRISDTARVAPGAGLQALVEWGSRAHAGLFVVRTGLETERERVVREATELGTSILGEPLGGSSVTVVRERIERARRG